MLYVTVTATINQPVERVFAYVTDVASHVAWHGQISEARLSPPGPVRVGSTYHYATETRGKRTESAMQVTWFEPNRFWVIETTHLPSPIETSFLFEPVTGGTRLTVQTHLPGIAPAIAREMVRKQIETTLREQLQRIRDQLQPGSGAEGAA